MDTKTPNNAGRGTADGEFAPTIIFEVLASDRRRYTLHYLHQRVGSVSLGELAEQLALWEDDPTHEHYERILTGLHHIQLPKLADAGFVAYDHETETVTGLATLDQVTPYLDLAMPEDLP